MNLGRCPVCHSRLHLDQLIEDDAGRGLLALLTKLDRSMSGALVSYLSLFRSKTRDLSNDRALRLAEEALSLAHAQELLPALCHTVEQMRQKQQTGGFKPLTNHNYLKRVLENRAPAAPSGDIVPLADGVQPENRQQKRARISDAVMNIHDTNW